MADYNPWRGLELQQQDMANAGTQIPGMVQYHEEHEEIDPQLSDRLRREMSDGPQPAEKPASTPGQNDPRVDATARAMKHIMEGGDPVEAAHKARAHIANPEFADQIWSHPDRATWEAQQTPGRMARGPQRNIGPIPQQAGLGAQPADAEPMPEMSDQDMQAALAGPNEQGLAGRPGRVAQATPAVNVTINKNGGLGTDAQKPMTRRDLEDFTKAMPTIIAERRAQEASKRLEERLASIERENALNRAAKKDEGAANRSSKEKIAEGALKEKYTQIESNHRDRLAAIAAQLQKVRESKSMDQRIKEEQLFVQMYDNANSALAQEHRSDLAFLDPSAAESLHGHASKLQDDLDQFKPVVEQIKRRALAPPAPARGSSSSHAAPPSLQQEGAKKLSDLFNEGG